MKAKRFSLHCNLLAAITASYFIMAIFPQRAALQPCPQIPGHPDPPSPKAWCWPSGATVKVVINSNPTNQGFDPNQAGAIWTAFDNWNAHRFSTGNCSGSSFPKPPALTSAT